MNVDQVNFAAALQLVREHLPSASFVAVDLEFTGLGLDIGSQLDTPQRRYDVCRANAIDFPPCQFGLTIFRPATHADSSDERHHGHWEVLPFNFWLCQRPVMKNREADFALRDVEYKMQASCVQFLWENGFDFNRMFGYGISWLRKGDEASIRAELEDRIQDSNARVCKEKLSKGELDWVEANIVEELEIYFSANVGNVSDKNRTKLMARHDSSTVRKYVFDLIQDRYPRLFVETVPSFGMEARQVLVVEEMPTAEEAKQRRESHRRMEAITSISKRLDHDAGFRKVVDAITEAKVPIVLHNGLYDICKIYAHFIDDLPPELSLFKKRVHDSFPFLIDTKYLLDEGAVQRVPWVAEVMREKKFAKGNALDELDVRLDEAFQKQGLQSVQIRPYLALDQKFESDHLLLSHASYSDEAISNPFSAYFEFTRERYMHEAGYDSLVTGKLFVQLVTALCGRVCEPTTGGGDVAANARKAFHAVVREEPVMSMVQRIAISSCCGYTCLNLNASEINKPESNKYKGRRDIVVMYGFRRKQKKRKRCGNVAHADMLLTVKSLLSATPFEDDSHELQRIVDEDAVLVKLERRRNRNPSHTTNGDKKRTLVGAVKVGNVDPTQTNRKSNLRAGTGTQSGNEAESQLLSSQKCSRSSAATRSNSPSDQKRQPEVRPHCEELTAQGASLEDPSLRPPWDSDEFEASLGYLHNAARDNDISVATYDEAVGMGSWKRIRLTTRERKPVVDPAT